jgi:hypothetical protein
MLATKGKETKKFTNGWGKIIEYNLTKLEGYQILQAYK